MGLDARYVVAPNIQYFFVNKDTGLPLANGTVYFWQDTSRLVPKAVYQITGTPPNYSYIELPNPLTLSGAGIMVDDDGNPIIPYFFPFDGTADTTTNILQLYFLQVYDEDGNLQQTVEGWPNVSSGATQTDQVANYIPNGQFLSHNNIAANALTNKAAGYITNPVTQIAQGGWTFERPSGSTATDIVLFNAFGSDVTVPSASPEYEVNIETQVPNAGDSFKYLGIRFPDVNKFSSLTDYFTFSFAAQSNTGSTVTIQCYLIRYFGNGGSTTTTTAIGSPIAITTSYTQWNVPFVPGNNIGKTIGPDGDSYVQIVIGLPTGAVFDLSFTDFVFTDGNIVITTFPYTPNASFLSQGVAGWMPTPDPDGFDLYLPLVLTSSGLTFSQSDVGKIFPCSYLTANVGELLCDGSQYYTNGYSSDGIPYARLQRVLYNSGDVIPIFGTGSNFVTVRSTSVGQNQLVLSTNSVNAASAASDGLIATNFTFSSIHIGSGTKFLNAYIQTLPSEIYIIMSEYGVSTCGAGNSGFTVTTIVPSIGGDLRASFTVQPIVASGLAGKYFTFTNPSGSYYVWFKVNASGSDPAPGGTGILVNLFSTDDETDVVLKVQVSLNDNQSTSIITAAASSMTGGCWFTFGVPSSQQYYVWYEINGVGSDPAPSSQIGIPVVLTGSETAAQVGLATIQAVNSTYFAVPNLQGLFIRGYDPDSLFDQPENRFDQNYITTTYGIGSLEYYSNAAHNHEYIAPNAGGSGGSPGGGQTTLIDEVSNSGGSESRPVNMALNYVIKY